MLYLLKTTPGSKQRYFPGKPPFNPLNLPSYFGGFLMNYTNDVDPGTIDPVVANRNWYDTSDLTGATKLMTKTANTTVDTVNGFTCVSFLTSSTSRYTNVTADYFNGVTDFTAVVGFKRVATAGGNKFLFSIQDTPNVVQFNFLLSPTNKISAGLSDGIDTVTCNSISNYADNTWHAAVVSVDQINKTVRLYTDLGEVLTASNVLFNPSVLTPNSSLDFQIGQWVAGGANAFFPGYIGDLLFFNTPLGADICQGLLDWEKNRLGI